MARERKWLDKENVNLMVAICAVLISAASFYATYVQSDAAERQVKAETWPYLQIDNGNYDLDTQEHKLYMRVENAGVGPAHLKQFQLYYKNQPVRNILRAALLCCADEGDTVLDESGQVREKFNNFITGDVVPRIIPAGEHKLVFSLMQTEANRDLWSRLDRARFDLTATGCYCSLLDDCFETDFEAEPVPVKACRREPDL